MAGASFAVGTKPKMVAVSDLNADGRMDAVSANQDSGTVSVLIGNGSGGFATAIGYPVCTGTHEVAIADFNGDGKRDLAVACWGDPQVDVLLGIGNGTFGGAVGYTSGTRPHSVVAGDFDGDGDQDLAIANNGSANMSILRNAGNGTFTAPVTYSGGTGPHSIRAADLNADGALDLAMVNDESDNVSVFIGNGNATFRTVVNYPTGLVPKGVAIGDLNRDGLPDLVATNTANSYPTCCHTGDDTVSVLVGTGGGAFGTAATYTVGIAPFAAALGDFDGDGDLDLATANWHSGNLTVLTNLSGADSTPPAVSLVSPAAGATSVSVDADVTATFSEPIAPATLSGASFTLSVGGGSVPASMSYDSATRTATLNPTASLPAGATGTAAVHGGAGGVTDLAGNPLVGDVVWAFGIATASPPPSVQYVSDLVFTQQTNGWGPIERDRSNAESAAGDGRPLTLAGVVYGKGLGVHARADVRFGVPTGCTRLTAKIGVDDEVGTKGSVVFEVWSGSTRLLRSAVLTGSSATATVDLQISPGTELRLLVTDSGNGQNSDHADWADARLTCDGAPPP